MFIERVINVYYMNFNRSCSYVSLAYMVGDFNLEYSDKLIAKEMKLAYLFSNTGELEYSSGAMLQNKVWFDLFLNKHSLEFLETVVVKEKVINYLKSSVNKLMIGLNLPAGKHAMVYCPSDTILYRFFNPHYINDGESDYIVYSEEELLRYLDEDVVIGRIECIREIGDPNNELYRNSYLYLDKYVSDVVTFCSDSKTKNEIHDVMESLFAPLFLTIIPLLEFEEETDIVYGLKTLQKELLSALRSNSKSIILSEYINFALLNKTVRELKEAIRKQLPPLQ